MTEDQSKAEHARLYRLGSREIRGLLNEWDPIPGSPEDEYDCLIPQLYAMLSSSADAAEVERYITDELRNHFGIEPATEGEHEIAAQTRSLGAGALYRVAWAIGLQGTFPNARPGEDMSPEGYAHPA